MAEVDQAACDEILARLDRVEHLLRETLNIREAAKQSDWVDSRTFCQLVSLRDTKSLVYHMSKGIFDSSAVRNIGTVKRPRYRFHRIKAVDQFLNRSVRLQTA